MLFKSPSSEPVQVALPSGHVAQVPPEGAELPPLFHRRALAAGCIAVGDADDATNATITEGVERLAKIRAAVEAMVTDGINADFTHAGLPKLDVIAKRSGCADVTAAERDIVWAEFTA